MLNSTVQRESADGIQGISYGGRLWFTDTDAEPPVPETEDIDLLNTIQID